VRQSAELHWAFSDVARNCELEAEDCRFSDMKGYGLDLVERLEYRRLASGRSATRRARGRRVWKRGGCVSRRCSARHLGGGSVCEALTGESLRMSFMMSESGY
jgi:hypothetical protein